MQTACEQSLGRHRKIPPRFVHFCIVKSLRAFSLLQKALFLKIPRELSWTAARAPGGVSEKASPPSPYLVLRQCPPWAVWSQIRWCWKRTAGSPAWCNCRGGAGPCPPSQPRCPRSNWSCWLCSYRVFDAALVPVNSSQQLLHAPPLPVFCFYAVLEKNKKIMVRFGQVSSSLFSSTGVTAEVPHG